jgi:hypothetical protein
MVLWYLKRTGLLIMGAETLALKVVNLALRVASFSFVLNHPLSQYQFAPSAY